MFNRKDKFTFSLPDKCFFTKSQDQEKQAYSKFIRGFQVKVDTQNISMNA